MPTGAALTRRCHRASTAASQIELTFYRITKRGVAETEAMDAFARMLAEQLPSMSR